MSSNAWQKTLNVDGVKELLMALGFKEMDGHMVLQQLDLTALAEALHFLLDVDRVREEEKQRNAQKSAAQRRKEREEEKRTFLARFEASRRESKQRPVAASHSQTTPFSGVQPKGFSDIGVDLNKGAGG